MFLPLAVALFIGLAGCDNALQKVGLQTTSAQMEADSRAVGGACRQSGRAIEDCYSVYSWLVKSYIYAGWRDMDIYMRENNLETVSAQLPPITPPPSPPPPQPQPKPRKKTKVKAQAAAAAETEKTAPEAGAPPDTAARIAPVPK
jgi:hypothetical protein